MDRTHDRSITRRRFIAAGGAAAGGAAAGLAVAPGALTSASPGIDKLRVAFVGVGGRGSRHLREVLSDTTYVDVVGICDLDEARAGKGADRVARALGRRPPVFTDHRKLLEAGGIDAVFSATPCDQHHRIYMDCIAAGKHLYGEKPMAITVAECDEIVAAQEKHPRVKVQIGFQRRSNPRFIEAVKRIREDRVLGPVLEGRAAYNNAWAPPWGLGPPGDWKSLRARSGDWMLEQAVHSWDVLNWIAGSTPVRAMGLGNHEVFKQKDPNRDVTDLYAAMIEYPDNVVIQFSHSWVSPPDRAFAGTYVRMVGLLGGVDLGEGKILWSSRAGKETAVETFQQEVPNDTTLAIRGFIDAIRHDRTPHSTVHNGRDASLVGLLVRQAVYERRAVTWGEMLAAG